MTEADLATMIADAWAETQDRDNKHSFSLADLALSQALLPKLQDEFAKQALTQEWKPIESDSFQQRVADWMQDCFTPEIAADTLERNDRFIEEALELVQSLGYSDSRAHALVDYVFSRETGDPVQEVGGVMVTLAALCGPNNLSMSEAAESELARINSPDVIEKIRRKQASKPTGSALPIPTTGEQS